MEGEYTTDDGEPNDERRQFLQGLAAAGIGLTAVPAASGRLASRGAAGTTSAAELLWYDGFEHQAIGDTGLEESDGSLLVSGEGVSAAVGEAESFGVQPVLDPEWEPESGIVLRGHGVVDGEPGVPIGDLHVTRSSDSDGFSLQPDFGHLGAETYRIEAFRDGDLVYEGEGFEIPQLDIETEVQRGCPYNIHITRLNGRIIFWIRVPNPDCVDPHRFPDDIVVDVDDIRVFPEGEINELEQVTNVNVYADGLSQFALDGETVGVDDHLVRQVGDSRLFPDDGGQFLGVAGLAESDGIAVELDDPDGFGLELDGFELHPEGAALTTALRGTADGRPGVPVGTASLRCEGESVVASADFSNLDAESVRVAVFEGGDLVGETETASGDLALIPDGCLVCWCGGPPLPWPKPDPWPPEPKPFPLPPGYQFEDTVEIELSDGSVFEGDAFQVAPADPGVEVESTEEFALTGEGVEQAGISGIRSY